MNLAHSLLKGNTSATLVSWGRARTPNGRCRGVPRRGGRSQSELPRPDTRRPRRGDRCEATRAQPIARGSKRLESLSETCSHISDSRSRGLPGKQRSSWQLPRFWITRLSRASCEFRPERPGGWDSNGSHASRMRQIGVARRNSGEDSVVYAASRINQLRKSSSAASHFFQGVCVVVPSAF